MRYLIITRMNHPAPPEAMPGLIEAMNAWVAKNKEAGKMEQVWSFAGRAGGGGILNVDSHEELDAIMIEFPFSPFSHIEVHPMTNLEESLRNLRRSMTEMMR